MPRFQYKARDRMGTLMAGTMVAPTSQQVGMELARMGHFPVSIELDAEESLGFQLKVPERFQRVKSQELVLFTRQMATLFHAGLPILTILESLEEQVDNPYFKAVVNNVRQSVGDGLALSEALARHPKVFPPVYVSMIAAGEAGGIMDDVLGRLADLLEKQDENSAKIKAAFRYPKIVLTVMVLAIAFLMWKVVPVFINLFETIKLELPLPTRMLIAVHGFFVQYGLAIILVLGGAWYLFKRYIATHSGRRQWDYFRLKVPLLGPINLRSSMAQFSRIFGNLQGSGVPILEALRVSSKVVDNTVLSDVLLELTVSVEEGKGLAQPLKDSGWVPSLVVQMVAAGESSGTLDEMLIKVADYYDQEVERGIKGLATYLEPILIVIMGVLVLFLALSIFLPMWDMSKMATR